MANIRWEYLARTVENKITPHIYKGSVIPKDWVDETLDIADALYVYIGSKNRRVRLPVYCWRWSIVV